MKQLKCEVNKTEKGKEREREREREREKVKRHAQDNRRGPRPCEFPIKNCNGNIDLVVQPLTEKSRQFCLWKLL